MSVTVLNTIIITLLMNYSILAITHYASRIVASQFVMLAEGGIAHITIDMSNATSRDANAVILWNIAMSHIEQANIKQTQ